MATTLRTLDAEIEEADDRRRAERYAVAVSRSSVREHGAPPADATLLDISIYGCRIAFDGAHQPGARLWLRLDGGWPISATVVWADGELMGCRFDQPIAGSTMRDLIRGK